MAAVPCKDAREIGPRRTCFAVKGQFQAKHAIERRIVSTAGVLKHLKPMSGYSDPGLQSRKTLLSCKKQI